MTAILAPFADDHTCCDVAVRLPRRLTELTLRELVAAGNGPARSQVVVVDWLDATAAATLIPIGIVGHQAIKKKCCRKDARRLALRDKIFAGDDLEHIWFPEEQAPSSAACDSAVSSDALNAISVGTSQSEPSMAEPEPLVLTHISATPACSSGR